MILVGLSEPNMTPMNLYWDRLSGENSLTPEAFGLSMTGVCVYVVSSKVAEAKTKPLN